MKEIGEAAKHFTQVMPLVDSHGRSNRGLKAEEIHASVFIPGAVPRIVSKSKKEEWIVRKRPIAAEAGAWKARATLGNK